MKSVTFVFASAILALMGTATTGGNTLSAAVEDIVTVAESSADLPGAEANDVSEVGQMGEQDGQQEDGEHGDGEHGDAEHADGEHDDGEHDQNSEAMEANEDAQNGQEGEQEGEHADGANGSTGE